MHDTNTLRNRVAEAGPGSTADLVLLRDGSEKRLSVKLDEASRDKRRGASDGAPGSDDKTALGVSVAPLTPELAAQKRGPRRTSRADRRRREPGRPRGDAGIQAGDIIQEVNRQPVKSVDELRAALKKTSDKPTLVLINRQGNDIFLTVRPANG